MGRSKRDRYRKSLHEQAHEKLTSMLAIGESRREDKRTGADRAKIYSYSTYKAYRRSVMKFVRFIHAAHPDCTSLKYARRYVNEWLALQEESGASAWTMGLHNSALCKLYQIHPDDPTRYHGPRRRRQDIKRSRCDAVRDSRFSVTNNAELIKFCCATGCRRNILERLTGDALWSRERMRRTEKELSGKASLTKEEERLLRAIREALELFPEEEWFLAHLRDKGGRDRLAPIADRGRELVIQRLTNTPPDAPVFHTVHSCADIHAYRGVYAKQIYLKYARQIADIPYDARRGENGPRYQRDVYCCRGDERGRKFDRRALFLTSKSLGHNRCDVVANSYLYGL